MTSQKQRIANTRNSLLSRGPKSEVGQRRSALNAFKRGLTASVELTPWGEKVAVLEVLLKTDGINASHANDLARRLLDYERNVEYQRRRFREKMMGSGDEPVISQMAQNNLDIAAQIALTIENNKHKS